MLTLCQMMGGGVGSLGGVGQWEGESLAFVCGTMLTVVC